MIGLSFAAAAAKLCEAFGQAAAALQTRPAGVVVVLGTSAAARLCAGAAGEPEGARPASDAINRGHAETTPQAIACGVAFVKKVVLF